MAEVSDAAGFSRSRSADYVVVNLWPSRGLEIYGIELKSYRSDWLSELKKPDKAENVFKYCDRFYLLTTDDTIAKLEEIPASWGWMCIKGNRIFIKKEAPKLNPEHVSKSFLATMLKRAQSKDGFILRSEIQAEIDAAKELGKNHNATTIQHYEKTIKELTEKIKEFEQATGVDITHYYRWKTNPQKIGKAVKLISENGIGELKEELLNLKTIAEKTLGKISETLKEITPLSNDSK